ncbi:MAG TPA: hypothetical protein VME45_13175 [Stellaceae bacterium]|nr:hypothetical protein [Stellaceae bacterium]
MTIRATFFTVLAFFAFAVPALADGTVLRAKGCGGKVFVATEQGFSVLEATELGIAQDNDKLVGNTNTIGYQSFFIPESGRRFSASVDETGLGKSEVTTRIAASCRSAAVERVISGQVERAAGCGNKIFVNTDTGYVVLDRLAGGLVYPGDTLTGDFTSAGRTTAKDRQTGAELVVFVDDFELPKSAAQRKITESCR